ncbi:MAG: hypothetical protein KME20_22550 [Kaiparowitsia implicata GSE-PSE-MK54-09C]|nr:hypothetical protein [Kaiparowitsia implicata GSE-PSE-MK54-09C]
MAHHLTATPVLQMPKAVLLASRAARFSVVSARDVGIEQCYRTNVTAMATAPHVAALKDEGWLWDRWVWHLERGGPCSEAVENLRTLTLPMVRGSVKPC